ncbi:semaphorin-5A-like isoform X1 [Megalops cyprinoides]|uniref:semaphorin-5A-like isoform X1 n=1 Tax=Megalops cyprinoides TaxID=118141 RepID=UPI0018648312|nr:semaphorin-5A-like isoform X1 [Megalops cyprinoides]XP_036374894.1 semaphorin-5A-like isoform X1 [Megalops cyprinoides]
MAPAAGHRPSLSLIGLQGVLFLLVGGVASRGPALAPESPCHRVEHPVISHAEVEPWIHRFRAEGTVDYSQLTFDPGHEELIVGARNHLFRLSLEDLSLIQGVHWQSDEFTKAACFSRGKSEEECQNYIRVLLVNGDRLFTCGTNAFTPICTNRTLTNLTEIHEQISGMARCPYSPRHNSTVLLTKGGELYAATAMDFSGRDPAIYRSLGALPPLRTAQYNSKWLNEPNFVSSYDIGNFTYFFFRENAVEHDCGRTVFSRVARVCKNDIGGRFLLEDTWTTFMKARLNCSRPGDVPFYYSELQGTFLLPELELLYAIFTTNVNSMAASAVCVFNFSAINQVFSGPFRFQENSRTAWLPYPNPNPTFQCGTIDSGSYVNLTERNLQDAQKFLLMHEVVQPASPVPHFLEDGVRFSHVVVDVVQGKEMLFHILYLATDYGTIKKVLSPLNRSLSSCVLDEIELFPLGKAQPIRSLLIQPSRSVLFVGVQDQVIKVQLRRCGFHRTREACVGARDPYCGWDLGLKRCTTLEESLSMSQWEQIITECPRRNVTVDGGFGPWSGWRSCGHSEGGVAGSCLCRTRACDNPSPQCGGQQCPGSSVEVTNCSRNGAWTPWSPWAPCSTSCGIGFQVRLRTCSNPAPRHGGRVCVGQNRDERYCNEHLPCPPHVYWSGWSPWERCSVPCGGGVQSRRRTCENGNECPGCGLEFQFCNILPCPDLKKTTPWTPWAPVNISDHGGSYEQRFRYTCKARVPDPALLDVGRQRIEMRYCSSDGSTGCSTDGDLLRAGQIATPSINGGWSPWSSWAQCSRDCGRGIRNRKRVCSSPEARYGGVPCLGPALEYQECNITPCPVDGGWSCWSSWSRCSVTCGGGHYTRTRTCSSPAPAYGGDICLGLHTEEALCNTQPCSESWSQWSRWSQCDSVQVQARVRHCDVLFPTGNQCSGNSTETRACSSDSNLIPESIAHSSLEKRMCEDFNWFHMLAVGLSSSILGCLTTLLVYTYCQRYQQQSHDATVIHPVSAAPLNTSITNHINKLDKYDPVEALKIFNKKNLILEERNKYFSPHLATKTYANSYFTDVNTFED